MAMTDAEKIRLLTQKLQETVNENDRLKTLLANLTEGANALSVLQSLYRNGELPEALRAKCAGLALAHESPPLKAMEPPIELVAEKPEPLAQLVERQRARADRMQREARDIRVLPSGQVLLLDDNGGNGSDEH